MTDQKLIAYFTGNPNNQPGIYCYSPNGMRANGDDPPTPWNIPRMYPLGDSEVLDAAWGNRYGRIEVEGVVKVLRQDGWTLVTMFDKSGHDKRGGIHASFAFNEEQPDAAAVQTVKRLFPGVVSRIEKHLGREICASKEKE